VKIIFLTSVKQWVLNTPENTNLISVFQLEHIWLAVVGLGLLGLISLMLISVDPEIQYTVDEVMGAPEDFTSDEIHLRGTVLEGSVDETSKMFILAGTGENAQLFVDISSVALPDGFGEGYMIAVKGDLENINGKWTISANSIQTGCPSKYSAE
jgi:cytochrome c-type biogenesis protein CcmE